MGIAGERAIAAGLAADPLLADHERERLAALVDRVVLLAETHEGRVGVDAHREHRRVERGRARASERRCGRECRVEVHFEDGRLGLSRVGVDSQDRAGPRRGVAEVDDHRVALAAHAAQPGDRLLRGAGPGEGPDRGRSLVALLEAADDRGDALGHGEQGASVEAQRHRAARRDVDLHAVGEQGLGRPGAIRRTRVAAGGDQQGNEKEKEGARRRGDPSGHVEPPRRNRPLAGPTAEPTNESRVCR